ncbi:MAG: homoserine kinase [Nevskiaceae bacterium]|nr:MAG: homoserine kinase [Nevskiaceae bacterium]TBR71624.1 MAG: homoserine kinase [Nevskiaceae bacterium]
MSVFTRVSSDELHHFLERYPIGTLLGFQGIGEGVENTNYFVDTSDGRWVLTLFERTEETGLPYFLSLMEHLAERGFPCPAPAHTHNHQTLTKLNGRWATLVRRLEGGNVLFPTLTQCRQMGTALGTLHVLCTSFSGERANERGPAWRATTGTTLLPHVAADAAALIRSELAVEAAFDWNTLPHGVIHADCFRDNVLFVNERLSGMIDFYYACNDALLYDLAIAVNDWCTEPDGQLNHARAESLIGAYCACREPLSVERKAWNGVLRAAALRFYLSRLYDQHFPRAGDLVHVKEPDTYRHILEWHRTNPPPALLQP